MKNTTEKLPETKELNEKPSIPGKLLGKSAPVINSAIVDLLKGVTKEPDSKFMLEESKESQMTQPIRLHNPKIYAILEGVVFENKEESGPKLITLGNNQEVNKPSIKLVDDTDTNARLDNRDLIQQAKLLTDARPDNRNLIAQFGMFKPESTRDDLTNKIEGPKI